MVSKLVRNVRFVTSLEVSPFCFLFRFYSSDQRGTKRSNGGPNGERLGRSGGLGPPLVAPKGVVALRKSATSKKSEGAAPTAPTLEHSARMIWFASGT